MHDIFKIQGLEYLLTLPNYRTILCNAPNGLNNSSSPAQILATEVVPSAGGYSSQQFLHTPGTLETVSGGYVSTASQAPSFGESPTGAGYSYTHIALWQGRAAGSSLPVTVNSATGVFTSSSNHGITNGDPLVLASTGVLPSGASTVIYYGKSLSPTQFELYTTEALNTKLNVADGGTGQARICFADGSPVEVQASAGEVAAGQSVAVLALFQLR